MIVTITDEMRKNLTKGGSVLKRMRSAGGLPQAIFAVGIVLLVVTAITSGPFLVGGMAGVALAFGGVFGIPGFVLVLYGKIAKNRRTREYLDYYQKVTKLEAEELKIADREILEPETVLIGRPLKNKRKKDYTLGCFITEHYLIVPGPGGTCYIRRIQDMAAAIYTNEIPGIDGCKSGIVYMAKSDDLPSYNAGLTKDECIEVITILKEKNLELITEQRFLYQDKQYDIVKDYKEVAACFKEMCR